MEENENLEALFSESTGETYAYDTSGDTLVDMSKLFEKIDFNKVDKIVQDAEKIKRRDTPLRSRSGRRKGIINEDYLRDLIRDEVMSVFEDRMDEILSQISYSIERLVTTQKPSNESVEDNFFINNAMLSDEEQLNDNTGDYE